MAAHKPVGEELREVMRLAIARREPFSRWRQIANDDAEEIAREVRVPLASIEDEGCIDPQLERFGYRADEF